MMRGVTLSILLVVLSPFALAAASDGSVFQGDLQSLHLNEQGQATATVVNPLPVDDTITLKLGGDAINNIIDARIVADPGAVTCPGAANLECFVSVGADSRQNVNITVEATAAGDGVIVGTVNSSRTNLANRDELDVRVTPRYGGSQVSSPGITTVFLVLIALLGGLAVFVRSPDPA